LGYQNVGQLYKQHGRDGAQAILGSISTQIFLPGLDSETAQYAVKRIGRTTVLQHTNVDAPGSTYDNERLAETGRDLIDPAELRQMAEYTQAIAIIGSAPPIKFGFPQCAKDGRIARALPHELAIPITLAEAEKATETARAEDLAEPAFGKAGESQTTYLTTSESDNNTDDDPSNGNLDLSLDEEDVQLFPEDTALSSKAEKRPSRSTSYPPGGRAVLNQINEE
jgi:type IV secretory pathway TraG/TraD family ATPase VirD4